MSNANRKLETWLRKKKRCPSGSAFFSVYIEICPECCGKLRVIACIDEPLLIAKILVVQEAPESHLQSETNTR